MYKIIIAMLEDDMTPEQIAVKLDLPVKQVRSIEADYFEFI